MTIWTPKPSASTTGQVVVQKTRTTTITLPAKGLKPNSQFTFWCNGVDMTWACRTSGTKQGTGLFSDDAGNLTVLFSVELGQSSGSTGSTKYHNLSLQDINGVTVVQSLLPQQLN